jgi:hypothetical protein
VGVLIALILLMNGDLFVTEATAEAVYTVELSREALAGYVDDIGLFERNMPGVVGVTDLGGNRYLYLTEKELPLAGTMQTEFRIEKITDGDSTTIYRSVDSTAENYMYTRVIITPSGPSSSRMQIVVYLRLSREDASEVHWMAPLMGEEFISYQMTKDLRSMLETFVERSTADLYQRVTHRAVSRE